jgi:hypothetical protein
VDHPYGGIEEGLADIALRRRRDVHYLTTLTIVNAILSIGQPSAEAVKKSLDNLKQVLFPEEEARLEEHTARIKETMEREMKKGPLKIKPVDSGKKRKRRRGRR